MERRRPRKSPDRPLLLVVEGHDDTRALYTLALSANGFEVVALADGAEAFDHAWQIHPDVIVTDLPMPNCDDSQFLHALKQHPRTRDIPVVAVSGYVQPSLRERDGFAAFFPKPCLPEALAAGLRQLLDEKTDAHVTR